MIIDLRKYGDEFGHWTQAVEPFVDAGSSASLKESGEALAAGVDRGADFRWAAPRPVKTITTESYDGVGRKSDAVHIVFHFEATFEKRDDRRERYLWNIRQLVTQVCVISLVPPEGEALHFHFDLKNGQLVDGIWQTQLGPHSHMQVSEQFLEKAGKIKLAVPRFPSATLLPTDCMDLVLAEFFPTRWPQEQANANGINALRTAQLARIEAMSRALFEQWRGTPKMTPFSKLQNCWMPDIRLTQ